MKHDMTNIAYTPEYQARRQAWDFVFAPEHLQSTGEFSLDDGYTCLRRSYQGKSGIYNITESETVLNDAAGAEVYRWRDMDNGGEFAALIHHSNGRAYLLFRIDLYGYGVFDLAAKKDFFYAPKAPETFIWTGVHYSLQADMLAVEGCYWACPNGLFLVEFSEPMRESKWVDVIDLLDGDYDNYDAADFVRWDGDALVVKADRIIETNGKITTIPEEITIDRKQFAGG